MRLHHVGVAVEDMDAAIALYQDLFGAELVFRTVSEAEGLEAAFLRAGASEIELMRATRADSAVGKFVAKRGPGLHHVAYSVGDIEEALAQARGAGMQLIDETPRRGMHGTRIAFIHPKSVGGVLTELVEA